MNTTLDQVALGIDLYFISQSSILNKLLRVGDSFMTCMPPHTRKKEMLKVKAAK